MADSDVKTAESSAAVSSSGSQKNPFVAILLVFNMIALGAVAFFQYKFMKQEAQKPDLTQLLKEGQAQTNPDLVAENARTETLEKGRIVELEDFTVNLAQGDGPRRYVRLKAVLKVDQTSAEAEVQARVPQIRDTVISILNSKRAEDLLKRDGKLYLKEQIKSAINSFLVDGKVVDVFYINFQIN
jgi:flagellar protein FliL